MSELETQIVDISDEALDELFNETPNKTVNADTLLGGKKKQQQQAAPEPEEDEEEEIEEQPQAGKKGAKPKPTAKTTPQLQQDHIEDVDIDNFNDGEEDEEETDEEIVTDESEEEEEQEKKTKKGTKRAQAAEEKVETAPEVLSVLKSTADYLVKSGIWADFEGREEMDLDEETYAKLVTEQDKVRVQNMFSELVDSTGPFGKAIIDFVKNGGNPDEIIDLFKEQKQVESIKTDSPDGQKELIKHYYTEVMGWKPEKVDKYISGLVLNNELEPESAEVKELFGNFYKKETERLNKEQTDFAAKQKEAEAAFETNIRSAIKERKDLTPAEKQKVEEWSLSYDQRLANGNNVNKFYVNFAKMQANPNDYIDLILFVMDKQKYVQKVATKEQTAAAAKAFSFIKGNGTDNKKRGSSYEQIKKNEKITSFDWGMNK